MKWKKKRLLPIDIEKRKQGYRFTKKIKRRWIEDFPNKAIYMAKNVKNNLSQIKKKEKKRSRQKIFPSDMRVKPQTKKQFKKRKLQSEKQK